MEDLVVWLREQIAFVERFAEAAQRPYSGDRWEVIGRKGVIVRRWPEELRVPDVPILKDKGRDIYLLQHVAMHDPTSVLAQCQAHTALLARYERAASLPESPVVGCNNAVERGHLEALADALRCVALAYRHRPGYRQEWRL